MGAGFETAPRLQHVVAGGTPFGGNRRRRVSNREHRLCVSGRAQGYQLPHGTGAQRHQQRLVDEALFLNRAPAQHPPTECRHPPFRLPSPSLPTLLAPCRPHFQLQPMLRSLVLRKTFLQRYAGFGRKPILRTPRTQIVQHLEEPCPRCMAFLADRIELVEEQHARLRAHEVEQPAQALRRLPQVARNYRVVTYDEERQRELIRETLRKGCLAVPGGGHQQQSVARFDAVRSQHVRSMLYLDEFETGVPNRPIQEQLPQRPMRLPPLDAPGAVVHAQAALAGRSRQPRPIRTGQSLGDEDGSRRQGFWRGRAVGRRRGVTE